MIKEIAEIVSTTVLGILLERNGGGGEEGGKRPLTLYRGKKGSARREHRYPFRQEKGKTVPPEKNSLGDASVLSERKGKCKSRAQKKKGNGTGKKGETFYEKRDAGGY